MSRRAVVALLALVLVGFVAWRLRRDTVSESRAPVVAPAPSKSAIRNPPSAISPPAPAVGSDVASLAAELNSPRTDIRADLRIVAGLLATFRSNFPRDGDPVGSNAEITAALTGHNRLHLALLPPDHPAINHDGELCDRWGTPYFFHAESGTRMAIRSAGPDRRMWTEDDVTQEP